MHGNLVATALNGTKLRGWCFTSGTSRTTFRHFGCVVPGGDVKFGREADTATFGTPPNAVAVRCV